jgi:hypothetical protein
LIVGKGWEACVGSAVTFVECSLTALLSEVENFGLDSSLIVFVSILAAEDFFCSVGVPLFAEGSTSLISCNVGCAEMGRVDCVCDSGCLNTDELLRPLSVDNEACTFSPGTSSSVARVT